MFVLICIRVAYNAVALHSVGKFEEAKSQVKKALTTHPNDKQLKAFHVQLKESN